MRGSKKNKIIIRGGSKIHKLKVINNYEKAKANIFGDNLSYLGNGIRKAFERTKYLYRYFLIACGMHT